MIVSLYDDINYYVVTLLYSEIVMRWACYVMISPQFNTTEKNSGSCSSNYIFFKSEDVFLIAY